MSLWWISWYQPGEDYRALTWPPPPAILAYWCSGYTGDGSHATVVALVRAPTAAQARAEVVASEAWPDAGEERFCEPRTGPPGDRFPKPTHPEMVARWPWGAS